MKSPFDFFDCLILSGTLQSAPDGEWSKLVDGYALRSKRHGHEDGKGHWSGDRGSLPLSALQRRWRQHRLGDLKTESSICGMDNISTKMYRRTKVFCGLIPPDTGRIAEICSSSGKVVSELLKSNRTDFEGGYCQKQLQRIFSITNGTMHRQQLKSVPLSIGQIKTTSMTEVVLPVNDGFDPKG